MGVKENELNFKDALNFALQDAVRDGNIKNFTKNGSLIGIAKASRSFWLSLFGSYYVESFRNIPLIVQMFLFISLSLFLKYFRF